MVSIGKKDLLAENPIIVNEKYEVIDGQHRLEAAKSLNKPIHYIVHKGAKIEEVQLLNSAVRAWRFEDYIRSYKTAGNKNYAELEEFCNKYKVPVGTGVQLLSGIHNNRNSLLQDFRDGKFEIHDREEASQIGHELMNYRNYIERDAHADRNIILAIMYMHDEKPVSHLSMLQRLQENVDRTDPIKRQATHRDYLRAFEQVYNKGKSVNQTRFF